MKILASLLFCLLSACTTLPKQTQTMTYSNSIPNAWSIQGRASTTHNNTTEITDFKLSRKDKHSQLTLTGSLGFGQIKIQQTPLGLLVDEEPSHLSLQAWMQTKLGWQLPINELENVIFKHRFTSEQDWQIKISRYQTINNITYPKIIRLNHPDKHIKIKLMLREINRLK